MALKSIVVFYHGDCLDGFGGAWAAWKRFGSNATYVPIKHYTRAPKGLARKEVYLIDIVFLPSDLSRIAKEAKKLVIIDHHKSARPSLSFASEYLYETKNSAAILAWQFFHPGKPFPYLLRLIEDYDLYTFKIPGAREILAVIDTKVKTFGNWNRLARDLESRDQRKEYKVRGEVILQYEQEMVLEIAQKAVSVSFHGKKALAVNSPVFPSEIGAELYKRIPIAIIWYFNGPHLKVSLRSKGVNVRKLAEKYPGGGGHDRAAGFLIKNAKKFPWKFLN